MTSRATVWGLNVTGGLLDPQETAAYRERNSDFPVRYSKQQGDTTCHVYIYIIPATLVEHQLVSKS